MAPEVSEGSKGEPSIPRQEVVSIATGSEQTPGTREASHYRPRAEGAVQCLLCPQGCFIQSDERGFCQTRVNNDGVLVVTNYGKVTSIGIDPIEKKPLYHFYPGRNILSLGTFGCSLGCRFCQNWQISQEEPGYSVVMPHRVAELAREAAVEGDSIGVAYTYSEPLMWYEYLMDTVDLVRGLGQKNVLVTNGYINPEPLRDLLPKIDALNIDVKAMKDDFYHEICEGHVTPVLRTVEAATEMGCHIEITNLVIPGCNDSKEDIRALVDWVASVNPDIPLHFSRYYPQYQMREAATPVETLKKARGIALEKLNYVYIGNAWDHEASASYCPNCSSTLIRRTGFGAKSIGLKGDRCASCGEKVSIVQE